MKNIVFISIFIALSTWLQAASVEASVNTQEVVKGNAVQLRIKAIGGSAAFPNIHDIDGIGVTNSGTSRQSSMQITVNGMKQERSTVRKYIFVPQHDMVIPSYTVRIGGKNYKTKPIQIKVVTSKAPQIHNNDAISFVLKSDKSSVLVGESFVVTVYVSIAERLRGIQIADYVAPTATGFFTKEIPGEKKYQHNGYTVIEKQYILTAKKEGNFTISPALAKLGQPNRNRQDIFGRYQVSWSQIASNPLEVEVKGLKIDTDLVGDFTLESHIDAQSVKANKPVNLTVNINGTGNLEDFELAKYEIDGVTIYSDEAKIESHLDGAQLVSSFSKSFAFIAEDDFTIPARSIKVYNPETKETKTLQIPAYSITIGGKKAVVTTTTMPAVSGPTTTQALAPEIVEKKVEVKTVAWWMLALAFMLGALMMYLLRFLPMLGSSKKSYKESEALKVLYAHISEDKAVEEMVRKLYAKQNGDKSVQIDKKVLREMVERFS